MNVSDNKCNKLDEFGNYLTSGESMKLIKKSETNGECRRRLCSLDHNDRCSIPPYTNKTVIAYDFNL